jgi:ABC-2 type transport system permease protein
MPALVGLSAVTWWAFAISVAISLLATYGVARFAARVYQRAILRTGARVPLRDALALRPRHRAT